MKKLYDAGNESLRPNVVAYNAVMNACAFTNGDVQENTRAVEIAHAVLKELEQSEHGSPDQVTYGTFLRVVANQMPDCDSRTQVVRFLFKKCCKDGQVGNLVIQQLKGMSTAEQFHTLTGHPLDECKVADLPSEWKRNVVEGKWRRRRHFEGERW